MDVLPKLPDEAFQLIHIDPPFNTGKVQARKTLETVRILAAIAHALGAGVTRRGYWQSLPTMMTISRFWRRS